MAQKEQAIGDGSLHVGDRVVYPNQGICRITGVSTKNIAGQNWEVVTLSREEDGATVMVPKAKVMGIGLRKVADVAAIDKVFDDLASPDTNPQLDWKVRHRENADRMSGGGLFGTVEVLKGDTATSLAPRLVKAGVVASTSSFVAAAKASSNPTGLEPGFFHMHLHMNSALAYKLLLTPSARIQTLVTIPEGLRLTGILNDLEKAHTSIPAADFAAAIKNTNALGLPSYANGNPEGFLFPATYTVTPKETALQVLQQMVARFKQEATSINLPAAAKKGNLTENQVITVASILMAEGGNPKYYPQIAEVIYNRLNQGIPLQLDSTVNFALAKTGIGLTAAQLKVKSPYNTFLHKGLPPGPIDSPGDTAIKAALHPDHGNLTFFVTVNLKTGLTEFTNSPARFQQLVALCRKNKAC